MNLDLLIQMVVPCTLALTAVWAMARRVDVYAALVAGAGEGLKLVLQLVPVMVALMTAVTMLRASGVPELLAHWLAPLLEGVGVPPEVAPLLVIRPVSGTAALGVGAELMARYGPDSAIGRTAAVLLSSTETTFYTLAVYFGAAGISRTRYALPAALCADLAAFLMAGRAVALCFGPSA